MARSKRNSIFNTSRRAKLGIWGLGRGLSFFKACAALNLEVVAGCDYNEHMRRRFQDLRPDAFVTADADAFLNAGLDAVLLATYCPAHGPDAIRCLKAGKHVLSEVTAFHTAAEGVALLTPLVRRDRRTGYSHRQGAMRAPRGASMGRKARCSQAHAKGAVPGLRGVA